jgi:hypothetical protein
LAIGSRCRYALQTWAIRAPEFASAFSRTFHAMPFKGDRSMSLHIPYLFPSTSKETASHDDAGLRSDWDQRIVTAATVSMAVLFVAAVAVLMGMS